MSLTAYRAEWWTNPDAHNWSSAAHFLRLLWPPAAVRGVLARLVEASVSGPAPRWAAKDILRAANLPALPMVNRHVHKDIEKIKAGEWLSPIIMVRHDGRLIIADGYHRVCACYLMDENCEIPAVIEDLVSVDV